MPKRTITSYLLTRHTVTAVALLGLLILPARANPYILYMVNLSFVYILLASGLNVLIGYAGQLAFANTALFGVGAYITGLSQIDFGFPYWLSAICGVIGTSVLGLIIAYPALRLRGLYLALATIAFAYSCLWVFLNWQSVTGGAGGFPVPPIDFAPIPVSAPIGTYYLSLTLVVIFLRLLSNMLRSRIGRAFVAIRESEVAAVSLGIDLTKYKTFAFGISAFFAGTAGAIFVCLLGVVTPESYDIPNIVLQFCMVMVGGIGSFWGAVLGAVLVIGFDEAIREIRGFEEAGFGFLILLCVLFMPQGLFGLLKQWVPSLQESLRRTDGETT